MEDAGKGTACLKCRLAVYHWHRLAAGEIDDGLSLGGRRLQLGSFVRALPPLGLDEGFIAWFPAR
jgi:hypothetical protein